MAKIAYITLKWDENLGQGVTTIKESFFTYEPKLVRLDMLKDCIYDLQKLYDKILDSDERF